MAAGVRDDHEHEHEHPAARAVDDDGLCADPEAVYRTRFRPGEYVVDREAIADARAPESECAAPATLDDVSVAVVVREGRATASQVALKDGRSVAADNPSYPMESPVVAVAFVEALDKMAAHWRTEWQRRTLNWRLDRYKQQWGSPIRTEAYPAPRLEHARALDGVSLAGLPGFEEDADADE